MALGAATLNGTHMKMGSATLRVLDLSFTGDTSYPTGGTADFKAYVQATIGLDEVEIMGLFPLTLNTGYDAIYDKAADKLLCKSGNTEVGNGTNLGGTTFRLAVLCY